MIWLLTHPLLSDFPVIGGITHITCAYIQAENTSTRKKEDKFTYLGSTPSRVVHIDDEVTARIAKASVAFGRLRANVWERNGIKLDTKLKV